MRRHPNELQPKVIEFHPHPEGKTCDGCVWLEVHDDSLRGHYDYFCRLMPVPAKISYEPTDYWCGGHKEKE